MGIYDRQKDLVWFKTYKMALIGGAGGISSWLTLFLSRIGCSITIYDNDTIEEHNLGGQFFMRSQLGYTKVKALAELVGPFSDAYLDIVPEKFTETSISHHIMFCGFDNMGARKIFYKKWKEHVFKATEQEKASALFLDGRLRAEQFEVFAIRGNDLESMNQYETHFLFDDDEVDDGPCTAKQTSHVAASIASMMVSIYTNHLTNRVEGKDVRLVPFHTEFFSPLLMLEITNSKGQAQ